MRGVCVSHVCMCLCLCVACVFVCLCVAARPSLAYRTRQSGHITIPLWIAPHTPHLRPMLLTPPAPTQQGGEQRRHRLPETLVKRAAAAEEERGQETAAAAAAAVQAAPAEYMMRSVRGHQVALALVPTGDVREEWGKGEEGGKGSRALLAPVHHLYARAMWAAWLGVWGLWGV